MQKYYVFRFQTLPDLLIISSILLLTLDLTHSSDLYFAAFTYPQLIVLPLTAHISQPDNFIKSENHFCDSNLIPSYYFCPT